MPNHLIVWDIETVPDLRGFAAANGHDGKADHEIREAMGDKFPKHIYHSIICIGALVAHCNNGHWQVDALGAPHIGDRPVNGPGRCGIRGLRAPARCSTVPAGTNAASKGSRLKLTVVRRIWAGQHQRSGCRAIPPGRTDSRDCRILRKRRAQHVQGLAPLRIVSWGVVL
jgi:hypothetical protein